MKQKPFISIIIPTFNSQDTLLTCLESVLKQTFKDFEILILDNISKDNTLSIAKSFNDCRIKIFSEADKGIYDAMNKGIDLANGDWIFFLGSDDCFYKNTVLEKLLNFKCFTKNDVIYGNVISSRFNGKYAGEFTPEKLEFQNICHQAVFFNKKVFKIIGRFNLKYKAHADWDHNIRWFYNSKIKKKYVDIVVSNYADGGFSSIYTDELFIKNKNQIIFTAGKEFLTLSKLIHLTTLIIKENKVSNNKVKTLYYIFLRFYLRKLRKFKKY